MKIPSGLLILAPAALLVGFLPLANPPKQSQRQAKPPNTQPQQRREINVFDLPQLHAQRNAFFQQVYQLLKDKQYDRAEQMLMQSARKFPNDPAIPYDLACVQALQGRTEKAFQFLAIAVEMGFRRTEHIRNDPDLTSLREDPRFQTILKKSAEPLERKTGGASIRVEPAIPSNGEVLITQKNLSYNDRFKMFQGHIKKDEGNEEKKPITNRKDKVGTLLRKWHSEGTAAGNVGDFYDNHDNDHSNMNFKQYPQLTRIEFGEEMRKRKLNYGLQNQLVYNAVVLGNSSTALTQDFWRSQPRHGLTSPGGVAKLTYQYRLNHLYFYPEHRDHDPGHNGKDKGGHGDVFPANTPYVVISQGSSGSDRPFMDAFAATLAAFRPAVKEKLTKSGLLMPTLQMIFRRSNRNVSIPKEYFTGKAHPTVFDGKNLDVEKMIRRAHAIEPDSLPPLAQFKVQEEDLPVPGKDFFDFRPHQRFIDTPFAIGRIYKTTAGKYQVTLDARDSHDPEKKPLTYRWVVLRGDSEKITIEKMDEDGGLVKITSPWHERRPVLPDSKLHSNRVDIGLFVGNGTHWSAPAIFSIHHPDNQERTYDEKGRILSVQYNTEDYADPRIETSADWKDTYHYEKDKGKLTGWTRTRKNQDPEEFTAEGRLVRERNDEGKPIKTVPVRYVNKSRGKGKFILEQQVVQE